MSKKDIKIFIVLIIASVIANVGIVLLPGIICDTLKIISTIIIIPTIVYISGKFIRNNENNKVFSKLFSIYILISFILVLMENKIYIDDIFKCVLNSNNFYLLFIICAYSVILKIFKDEKNSFVYAICASIIMGMQNIPNAISAVFYYLPFAVLGYNESKKIENEKLDITKIIFSVLAIILIKYKLDSNTLMNYYSNIVNESNNFMTSVSKMLMYSAVAYIIKLIYYTTKESDIKIKNEFSMYILLFNILDYIVRACCTNFVGVLTYGFKSKLLFVIACIICAAIMLIFLAKGKAKNIIKNKLIEKNKKYSANLVISILFIVLIFIKQIMFAKFGFDINMFKNEYYITTYIAQIILLLIPMFLFNKTNKKYNYLICMDVIFSIISLANLWYLKYQANLISLNQVQNVKYVKEIVNTLVEIVKLEDVLFVIDIPIIILLRKYILKFLKEENNTLLYKAVIIITLYTASIASRVQVYTSFKVSPYASTRSKMEASSLIGYYVDNINGVMHKDLKYKKEEEFKDKYDVYKESREKSEEAKEVHGIAKDKNVIIVQLEAMQNFLINSNINGKEITPNINKFLKENTYISNMHAQSYTTTADSEFAFATGILPLENGQSFSNNYDREYKDIYSVLKENGYYTAFSHGNVSDFWNRKNVYESFGVDNTMFINEFKKTKGFLVSNYLSDEEVYEQTIEKMKEYPGKYLQVISTASSHTPFKLDNMPDEYRKQVISIDVGEYKNTVFGNYLEACNYADYAFGKFIEKLKAEGMYDETVIMIFGDHYGISLGDKELAKYFKEEKNIEMNEVIDKYNFTNVLAGIKVPMLEIDEISYPTSKLDVKSTILDLLEINDEFSLGFSVFTPKNNVSTTNNLIITDKYFFDEIWYDLKTGAPLDLESLTEEENELLEKYKKEMTFKNDVSLSIGYNNVLKNN